jgi:ATP-dependent DNA helicase DinG
MSQSNEVSLTPPAGSDAVPPKNRGLELPDAPMLAVGLTRAVWLDRDGELIELSLKDAASRARSEAPILCHAKAVTRRLGCDPFAAYDLLELFAFVRPARFCTPTPRGLANELGLLPPGSLDAEVSVLPQIALSLLRELAAHSNRKDPSACDIAWAMARTGWRWGPAVLSAVELTDAGDERHRARGLHVWDFLSEWSEVAPPPPPGSASVSASEARHRLSELLDSESEARPQQADYASAVSQAFAPRNTPDQPNLVLAEAGTGTGKTLGYIAPASLWAQKNEGPVWISTYTRNLQRQLDDELSKLYPEPRLKSERVVIRKGRENYLCLLNFDEAVTSLASRPSDGVAIGLMARWAAWTRDGDMVGGDFPGWLADLLGRGKTLGLTDRRGECIYSACSHYRKCFIERNLRKAKQAEIVVANHALVMIQAALGGGEDGLLPTHYVFDEGHHVFDAADSAFAAHLSGQETHDLRRWLLGGEQTGRSAGRARGLRRRLEDLVAGDQELAEILTRILQAATALPGESWHQRIADGRTSGPAEEFLRGVRDQVYARSGGHDSPYSLEVDARPAEPELLASAKALKEALLTILKPMESLKKGLEARLDGEADKLDSDTRRRIEASCRSLERRGQLQISAWCSMLDALQADTPPEFTDWFAVERNAGHDIDVGMFRHWKDPTIPFTETLMRNAQGVVITSATLTDDLGGSSRDGTPDETSSAVNEAAWKAAEQRTGSLHLEKPAIRAQVASPFDYVKQTRVFVINDVRKDDLNQVAAAYRELFLASAGGGLGLFTAISRLRAVRQRLVVPLERAGLNLYAQHVDGMDISTLVDIFRDEVDSCLLGTDAVRDGVDVPGDALRLIVFDRVPWPRPDIQHRERRKLFGGRAYDDRLVRLKLRQAFGRLVRREQDRGIFVLLDPMMPSRLYGAFPKGVEPQKVGLAEAVAEIGRFFSDSKSQQD